MDREKVIKGLECCLGSNDCDVEPEEDCPYKGMCLCAMALRLDVLALLKEQEAKTGHWVSVKDRLPTYSEVKDDRVLVLLEDGDICSMGFDECIEDESIFGEWRQNFDPVTLGATDSYWMPLEGVTHWMPIPKLMQEGQ